MPTRRAPAKKSSTTSSAPPTEPGKAAASKPAPRKRAAPKSKTSAPARPTVTPDMRRGMIAEAAYLRAEKRGFGPGREDEDWLAAEAEVDALLNADSGAGPPQ